MMRRSDEIHHRIHVMLDVLLDTRIATVAGLNGEAAAKMLGNPKYLERLTDDMTEITDGVINNEVYRAAYAGRDLSTLALSRPTGAFKALDDLKRSLAANIPNTPFADGFSFEINVWPYQMDEDEMRDVETAVAYWLGARTSIRVVNMPLRDLSPYRLAGGYSAVFLYSLDEWAKLHGKAVMASPIRDVTLFCPRLYKDRALTKEECIIAPNSDALDPFAETVNMWRDFVGIVFFPAAVYSIMS